MKLLILTQKVDKSDAILGFFHRWLDEFAKHCEQVMVICLEKGEYDLPNNVTVLSLGKEEGKTRTGYLLRFYSYIIQKRRDYDTVFVHMNPEYVVLGFPIWKIIGKRIALWYVHRHVSLRLRLAALFSNIVFTSSRESFRIKSKKVFYVGHGIDAKRFENTPPAAYRPLIIAHVGRITPIKRIETVLEALKVLVGQGIDVSLKLAGAPVTPDDCIYDTKLKHKAELMGLEKRVIRLGMVDSTSAYRDASITVNAAPDGGMDKAVLESWAAGRAAFVSNRAFASLLSSATENFMYPDRDAKGLAERIKLFTEREDKVSAIATLSHKIREEYDVPALMANIFRHLEHLPVRRRSVMLGRTSQSR